MSYMRHTGVSEGSGAALAATAVEFEPTASKTQDWLLPAAPSIPCVGGGGSVYVGSLVSFVQLSGTIMQCVCQGKWGRGWTLVGNPK